MTSTAFLLNALAIMLGGGTVQLIIMLVRRRSELRRVNSEADSVVVASANSQVLRLEAELQRVSSECAQVRKDLKAERVERASAVAALHSKYASMLAETQQSASMLVDEFRKENVKLNKLIARLQMDLGKANTELTILKSR